MNKNFYLNIMATIMVMAVILLGVILINSVDRVHFDYLDMQKKLADMSDSLQQMKNRPAAPAAAASWSIKKSAQAAEPEKSGEKIANQEFYDPNAVPGDRIITAIISDVGNMNSLINNDNTAGIINSFCTSTLADRNYQAPDKFEPLMAESWTISPDRKVYTIKLRKGVMWQDFTDPVSGKEWRSKEVTAADFKFYVDAIKNPDTNCAPLRVYLKDLDRVEVVSDYEFKVHWSVALYQSKETTLGLSPLPRHLYHAYEGPFDGKKFNDDHQRNRMIVRCGPYRLLRWDKDHRIILTRYENYFGERYGIAPAIKYAVFEIIKHPNTRFQSLLSGSVDRYNLLPEQWVNRTDTPEFGPNGKISKIKYLSRTFFYIGYNLKNPLFQDKRVRQAMSYLVDKDKILKDVYFGLGETVTGPLFYDSPYYDKSVKPYAFDVEKAKALLVEAGWKDVDGDGILEKDGKKFEFSILQVANHPIQEKMLPLIKEDMAKAGVQMRIQTLEWSVYIQRLEQKQFEVCTLGWTIAYEPDFYQIWHSSEADKPFTSNHIGFKNAEADRIIEELKTTFDIPRRIELCHKFQHLLHEEQPYTFLFSPYTLLALSKRYQNVRKFPLGIQQDIMWTPKPEQLKIPDL